MFPVCLFFLVSRSPFRLLDNCSISKEARKSRKEQESVGKEGRGIETARYTLMLMNTLSIPLKPYARVYYFLVVLASGSCIVMEIEAEY